MGDIRAVATLGYMIAAGSGTPVTVGTWGYWAPEAALTVLPSGIASAEALGSPKLDLRILPETVSSAEVLGAAQVTPGPVVLLPLAVTSAQAFGAPALSLSVMADAIVSAETIGDTIIIPGSVDIAPFALLSAEAFGEAGISPCAVAILIQGTDSGEAFGDALLRILGRMPFRARGVTASLALAEEVDALVRRARAITIAHLEADLDD